MLLTLDEGNTNLVCAVFDGEQLRGKWRLSTNSKRTADEYGVMLQSLFALEGLSLKAIDAVALASVVPHSLFALTTFCKHYCGCDPLIIGAPGVKTGLTIKLDNPKEVGADRLVNARAALTRYKTDVVVVDFGTATTFDVVSKNAEYLGGVIAPGVNLSLDALRRAAAKLPDITIEKPAKVIGTSTVSAMQSGMYWGYVGCIEGIIGRIQAEYGKTLTTVATGGLAPLFAKATESIVHLEPDLTIQGLREIYLLNKGAS